MSPASDQRFNTWFPAVVLGLVISLIAAALWDILRRRTWTFVSRFWPGVLREVGLDHRTRVGEEQQQRAVTNQLSALSPQIITALAKPPNRLLMARVGSLAGPSNSSTDYDEEAQIGMNPLYGPFEPGSNAATFTATAYFPDRTPTVIINQTTHVFNRYEVGRTKRWKSSVVLQASLPVDPCVLAEIGELAKDCLHADHRCTFQLGNWAILYYNAGRVHIRELTEGDVPVNVESRWQEKRAGITMSGLYLTGAQVKVATEQTRVTLRDDGPAAQGPGDLDELFFPTDQVGVPEDDPLIHAFKVVQADGISLTVRSEASRILPPWEKSFRDIIWGRLQRISRSAKEMIKSLLSIEDQQLPELLTSSGQDLEHFELLAEHWKGVSEIELLGTRKEVLYRLHELLRYEIGECTDPQPSCDLISRAFIEDQYSSKYWQRGLHDLNQVILFSDRHQNQDALQRGLHFSIRGGIKFLLEDFEGAIQDFDLACYLGHGSTILFDRALAKSVLARFSEAMEDVRTVLASNRSSNDTQELQTCLQILHQRRVRYGPLSHSDQRKPEPIIIPDLLTGGDWCPAPEDDAPPFPPYGTKSNSSNSNAEVLEVGGCSGHARLLDTSHVLLQDHADLGTGGALLLEDHASIGDHYCRTFLNQATASKQPLSKSIDKTLVLQDSTDDDETETRMHSLCLFGVPGTTKSARFDDSLKEASISAGLSHPNITRMFSFATDKREGSIVMELMDGDLSSFIQRRMKTRDYPFEISVAVDIMLQLGAGVAYLHDRKIAHRDLKPKNILVRCVKEMDSTWAETEYVVAKVKDFGLSKSRERESMPYLDRALYVGLRTRYMAPEISSTRYMAPEVIQASDVGSSVKSGWDPFKANVYSYGMVCYEILTGKVPYPDFSNGNELRRKILIGDRPQLPQHCPPLLKNLIESCWSTHASERPSFLDICAELGQLKYSPLWPCNKKVDTRKEPTAAEEPPGDEIDQSSSWFRSKLSKVPQQPETLSWQNNIITTFAISPCPNQSTRDDLNQESSVSGSNPNSEQGASNDIQV